jgi:hypothetical protein
MSRWVLLAYRLPREPSTPRIALWRNLRRLGVAQVADGVVALPLDARTREQLEWLAEEVVEQGGEASVWIAEPGSAAQERAMAREMADAVTAECARVEAEANGFGHEDPGGRRVQARLRRELHRIGARDHFPTEARERARQAVEAMLAPEAVAR